MSMSKIAMLLCAAGAMGFTRDVVSAQSLFHFSTTPSTVTPGTPFTVDVDSTSCYVLFVGNHDGSGYGGVSVTGNIVEVRYGYFQENSCAFPDYVISQNVPGLPAGKYEVRAIFQSLASGTEFLETTFELQVGSRIPGAPHPIPALSWAGVGFCTLLVTAGAVAQRLHKP